MRAPTIDFIIILPMSCVVVLGKCADCVEPVHELCCCNRESCFGRSEYGHCPLSAAVGLCGECLLEFTVERLRCRHGCIGDIDAVTVHHCSLEGNRAERLQGYEACVLLAAHGELHIGRCLVYSAELVAQRHTADELLSFRYLAQRYCLAQIRHCLVFKRLEPFHCRH